MLYPLKFKPIYKEKIWGGKKIRKILKKDFGDLPNCGESWEISAIQDNLSVVSNGFLEGNNIEELIEVYMGDLVGEKVFEKYGIEFPLLLKFIDATDVLSVQVHPNDDIAMERHNAYGKTEMWYIVQADTDAEIIVGFNQQIGKKIYIDHVAHGNVVSILNKETAYGNDVFFIPAGRIHAIGAGILLAEIQQTSDITYRIYDWDRVDSEGKLRDLHTELAVDAIDYNLYDEYKTPYTTNQNASSKIISCRYFNTNILQFDKKIEKDYFHFDSFVIYMCLEGNFDIYTGEDETVNVKKGETVLIPAILNEIMLHPHEKSKVLEIYIA